MTRPLKQALTFLLVSLILLGVTSASAEKLNAPALIVAPFLYPPYPGAAGQGSVFDHASPNYIFDNRIVAFNGIEANKDCPSPAPSGTPPPSAGVCNQGSGSYWSYSLGDWMWYDGHDGIDYQISYRPVYAAADADQVIYAGWWDPQNHRVSLGIYVRLHHSNGYNTFYGHMSTIAVQACGSIGCVSMPHGEFLGISGTTGNSSGPHLHFTLRSPAGKSVDPYGWQGSGADPWINNQPESLWVSNPALAYYDAPIYPSGDQLVFPPAPAAGLIVDDGSANFTQNPDGCWDGASTGSAQGNFMLFTIPNNTAPTCAAQWNFPSGSNDGLYAIYVRIPAVKATTQGALYSIQHAGKTDQVVFNQEVFPNLYYVSDGWVYIGKYNFTGAGGEFIELTNRTQDESAALENLFVGVDAVRFVFQGNTPPTPPTPVTVTSTFTPTKTFTPTPSRTPTLTVTPSKTPTPTITRTSTKTSTFTVTRTPTYTPTASRTRTPTATVTPSRTPTITRTPTATATPSRTRIPTITRTPTFTVTASRTRTPTATVTPSRTPTVTRTITPTPTRRPTVTPMYTMIKVYFASRTRYNANLSPIEVTGVRWAKSNLLLETALNEYFEGPGATENFSYGWIAVNNGFTGYSKLEVNDGVAHVYLNGVCAPVGKDFNIADLIRLNLKQFPAVKFVKIYDQNGQTQTPTGLSDSEPFCLSQFFTPTVTPTRTPTPTRTSTPTRTPTNTRQPSPTPQYVKINLYFVSNYRYINNLPPFERTGVRWVRSNNVYLSLLSEYFEGPGATEKFSYGWINLTNGFTGYDRFELTEGGVAHIYLKGTCDRAGATYTIANLLTYNFKQFPEVKFVKIYDENGSTQTPTGFVDSIPACLQP